MKRKIKKMKMTMKMKKEENDNNHTSTHKHKHLSKHTLMNTLVRPVWYCDGSMLISFMMMSMAWMGLPGCLGHVCFERMA